MDQLTFVIQTHFMANLFRAGLFLFLSAGVNADSLEEIRAVDIICDCTSTTGYFYGEVGGSGPTLPSAMNDAAKTCKGISGNGLLKNCRPFGGQGVAEISPEFSGD